MSALYSRILLWHKLVAMRTGALALCSAKRALNPAEARDWVDGLRAVADDIEQFLNDGTFVLDDRGQRVVGSGQVAALEGDPPASPPRRPFLDHAGTVGGGMTERNNSEPTAASAGTRSTRHDQVEQSPITPPVRPSGLKAGGPRVAKRKTK